MSVNRFKPHIFVLPEDRANEEIANGFIQAENINFRAIQIERIANGWGKVVEKFNEQLVPEMRKFAEGLAVLLLDFDEHEDRLNYVMSQIPEDLKDRVFVLGVFSEPEQLKRKRKMTFEEIGNSLAKDCPFKRNELWEDALLKNNETELNRLILSVKQFLFEV